MALSAAVQESYRYQTVEKHILHMIEAKALLPGERVPSLRQLSSRMGMSISTVSQAYVELERKGVLESRPRSGFFVRRDFRRLPPLAGKKHSPRLEATSVNRSHLIQEVMQTVGATELVPLGVAVPDDSVLPGKALGRVMGQVMRELGDSALGYEPVPGNLELRRQIAFRSMDWGASVSPEDILITCGALEALYISLRMFTRPGDNVLIHSPAYFCFLQLLENLGLRAIEVTSCPECGVMVDDVERATRLFDIKAGIFCFNYANPDGSLTSEEVKQEIVELLAERNIPLVEDEVYADLHYGPTRPASCLKYDRKGLVVSCSSFSKTLAPGYRVGWIIPGRFFNRAVGVKGTTNVSTPRPTQAAVAEYLRMGGFDRHLKRLRSAIEGNMQALQLSVSRSFPEHTRMTRPTGGAVLWIELPGKVDSKEFFFRARDMGIGIAPGMIFSTQDRYDSFIRLSCTGVWSPEIEQGVKQLGHLAADMARG